MEKFTKISLLLDIYGNLLKGRRKEALNLYYNEDYSLTEIAEMFAISKQGVRDFLVKGEKELLGYEESLGILEEKFRQDKILNKLLELDEAKKIKEGIRSLIYYEKE